MEWDTLKQKQIDNNTISTSSIWYIHVIQINLWKFSIYFSILICDSLSGELIWTDPPPLAPRRCLSPEIKRINAIQMYIFHFGSRASYRRIFSLFHRKRSENLCVYLSSFRLNNWYVSDVRWIVNWIHDIDSSTLHLFEKRFD